MIWVAIVNFFNWLIAQIGWVISALFILLPNSPFSVIDISPISDFMGYMNYLVPVGQILTITTVWGGAIGTYYIIQIALRWVKVVE